MIAKSNIKEDKFPDRIALKICRKLLKADNGELTDEQVLGIRDFIHNMAKMYHDYYMRCRKGLHKSRVITFDDPEPKEKNLQDITDKNC